MLNAQQAVDWAKAAAIVGGLALGGYSTFVKGEPGANLAYKELARNFNELRTEFEKQRAYSSGIIDGLLHQGGTQPVAATAPAQPKPTPTCVAPKHQVPEPLRPAAKSTKPPAPPVAKRREPPPSQVPAPMPPELQQLKNEKF